MLGGMHAIFRSNLCLARARHHPCRRHPRRRSGAGGSFDCGKARLPAEKTICADPQLSAYAGSVSDSGEGRWTIAAAIDEGVPTPVLSAALYQRFSSRGRADVADKVLSAMRAGFGGHIERTETTR